MRVAGAMRISQIPVRVNWEMAGSKQGSLILKHIRAREINVAHPSYTGSSPVATHNESDWSGDMKSLLGRVKFIKSHNSDTYIVWIPFKSSWFQNKEFEKELRKA